MERRQASLPGLAGSTSAIPLVLGWLEVSIPDISNPLNGTQVSLNTNVPLINLQIVGVSVLTGTLALVAVAARLFTKLRITKSIGVDDYFSLAALIFAAARIIVTCILSYSYGNNSPTVADAVAAIRYSLNLEIAGLVLYLYAITFAKLAILAFYVRIFGLVDRRFRYICYFIGIFLILYCVVCTPLYVLSCLPSGARTIAQITAGHCIDTVALNLVVGAVNIATDSVIMLLPLPNLWKLQVSRSKRWVLTGVFLTGGIAWAASVVREFLFIHNIRRTDATNTEIYDIVWLTLEMDVGIIAGCLPILQPLIQRIRSHFMKTLSSKRESISSSRRRRKSKPSQQSGSQPLSSTDSRKGLSQVSHTEDPGLVGDRPGREAGRASRDWVQMEPLRKKGGGRDLEWQDS